jgi:hypothetical protein
MLARWTGWCDPCETERPLLLTEAGEHGVVAWLRGIGPEDRTLKLTCGVCGEWQDISYDEEDVAEVVELAPARVVSLRPVGVQQIVVAETALSPYPVVPIPAPRRRANDSADMSLDLVAEGLDLISLAS